MAMKEMKMRRTEVGEYETEHNGGVMKHPHIGHALMHMAKKMAPEMDHLHVGASGEGMTAHSVREAGKIEGPHEHETMADLADCPDCSLE